MELKRTLTENVVNPLSRARAGGYTVAIVTKADEHSNRCTVRFRDRNGNLTNNPGVMVDLRNAQEWFPNVGDLVIYDMSKDDGLIVSQYTEDYNSEIRGLKTLDNDRMADGESSVVGGTII